MQVRSRGAALLGAGVLVLAASLSATVLAVGEKVTLCHANSDNKDPYVLINTDIASDGYVQGGHADHGGDGVWYPEAKSDHFDWGDIIPPYSTTVNGSPFQYAGLNWTEAGQAIWENDCQLPGEAPDPSPSQSEADITDAPSSSPTGGVPDGTPIFSQGVGAITQSPTNTFARSGSNGPADGAWLLVVGLGVLLASIVVMTPARARSKR